jgi:DNA segregation ATPase FtsK/SpoIIIE and related proteins
LWAAHALPVGTGEPINLKPLLRIPLGLQSDGTPVWLDLKDEADGGNGPHGLLVGATGTGKSISLKALAFALCAQHSPELLQLVLLDGKDDGAFHDFAAYPHTAVIPAGTDYKAALLDLIDHRAEALRAANPITLDYGGVVSIVDGPDFPLAHDFPNVALNSDIESLHNAITEVIEQRLRERAEIAPDLVPNVHIAHAGGIERYNQVRSTPAGAHLPAVPYTVVMIDEPFLLIDDDPDFADVLDIVMRKARHLGIGVLTATQGLAPPQITNNVFYRIALRMRAAEFSQQLLGSDDAHSLPASAGVGLFCPHPGAALKPYRGFLIPPDLIREFGRQLADISPPAR